MQDKINELKKKIAEAIKDVHSSDSLFQIKMKFLGKSGEVSELMKGMRDVPKEKRPEIGMIINALKAWAEDQFGKLDKSIKDRELKKLYAVEAIDVTLPGNTAKKGAYHPNTLVRRELISIFAGMGFTVFEGPEIETDYYNFTALNTPADHPARDMQDTFYITDNL
ncbi:MAG: phenylalanine--tRNA ligase subunit alpha, partial [Clostridia bacterium]|nr:phenylalanine--tRNA ligase subunit alpha [Clostridia bacterium]